MAPKEIPPEEKPKPWTPDQPLADADQESEASERAQAHARYEYLKGQHLSTLKKDAAEDGKGKDGKKRKFFD